MTIDTAVRAALAPTNQARVALSRRLLEHIDDQSEVIHTNITPDRSYVLDAVGPDNRVDSSYQSQCDCPYN